MFNRVDIDEAAGLLDDAVDGGKAEARPLSHLFGREEGFEYLVDDRCRDPGAGIDDFDQDVVGGRHPLGVITLAVPRGDVGGAQRQPAALGHGVAGVDREVHDHLLELGNVDLDRPQIAAVHHVKRDLLADQPPQQHGEIAQDFADVEHLRAHGLLAREGEQMPHQAGRPISVLLDLHDVLERRVSRRVRVE